LPIPDASVDAIISNCVINLSPDKPQVWREMARVLKPGGRWPYPTSRCSSRYLGILEMVEALVGCVAGAVLISARENGQRGRVADIALNPKSATSRHGGLAGPALSKNHRRPACWDQPSDFITSLEITARKPPGSRAPKSPVRLQVYDPAMCCSTGVCRPDVDPALVDLPLT
jgi:hypothetical protein